MLKSMTGYGRYEAVFDEIKITCEIKSLNSKQIDISLKFPTDYREFDLDCRKWLSSAIVRGKVEVVVTIGEAFLSKNKVTIDSNAIKEYYNKIKQISIEKSIPEPNNEDWFKILLKLPDVLVPEESDTTILKYDNILNIIKSAFFEFDNFRIQEGNVLDKFLKDRLSNISELLIDIEKYEKERIQRINDRIEGDLIAINKKIELDSNRIAQEMIFYLEKLDISEEKSRLKCHIDYFLQTIDLNKNQGKKLGFIAQEIGREINTIGSKSNHSEMQKIVVMMKDELEQIKEQVLNVL